jgi:hypothetical protein
MSNDTTPSEADAATRNRPRTDGGAVEEDEEGLFSIDGRWFKIGFYLFLLGWLAYLMFRTAGYDAREDWLFPVVIAVPVTILLVLKMITFQYPQLIEKVLPDSASSGEDEMFEDVQEVGARNSKAEKEKYELIMIGWIIVLPFMMYFVGMGWTLILYTFAFTFYFTRNVRTSALVTGIVIVFVWVLFIEILQLIIWDGTLGLPDPLGILADFR